MNPLLVSQTLAAGFLAVLFLQSGIDKITDFGGNLSWLKEYFGKTFLKGLVTPMVVTITLVEIGAGICSGIGAGMNLLGHGNGLALLGAELGALNFVMLLFGNRVAKDYASSASTATYFILALACIYVQQATSF